MRGEHFQDREPRSGTLRKPQGEQGPTASRGGNWWPTLWHRDCHALAQHQPRGRAPRVCACMYVCVWWGGTRTNRRPCLPGAALLVGKERMPPCDQMVWKGGRTHVVTNCICFLNGFTLGLENTFFVLIYSPSFKYILNPITASVGYKSQENSLHAFYNKQHLRSLFNCWDHTSDNLGLNEALKFLSIRHCTHNSREKKCWVSFVLHTIIV